MNWILSAAAPAVVGLVFLVTGFIHPAIIAYHLMCAIAIYGRRDRVRTMLHADRKTRLWAAGTTALIAAVLLLAPAVHDLSSYRELFLRTLLPRPAPTFFWIFAAYSMIVHVPLEEIFWRGVVLDPAPDGAVRRIVANGVFFYLLHAAPTSMVLGTKGALFALPTLAAGAIWAFVTIRSRSLWPGLVSHWGADGVILGLIWFYFIR